MCKEGLGKKIDSRIFPGTQGGPLMHIIASKAAAFREALEPSFKTYARAVVNRKFLDIKNHTLCFKIRNIHFKNP